MQQSDYQCSLKRLSAFLFLTCLFNILFLFFLYAFCIPWSDLQREAGGRAVGGVDGGQGRGWGGEREGGGGESGEKSWHWEDFCLCDRLYDSIPLVRYHQGEDPYQELSFLLDMHPSFHGQSPRKDWVGWFAGWLLNVPANMLMHLRHGSAQTFVHAATLRLELQIKLSISSSHSILTPGQQVPALTLLCQAPGSIATGVPIFKSMVWLNLKKSLESRNRTPALPLPKQTP